MCLRSLLLFFFVLLSLAFAQPEPSLNYTFSALLSDHPFYYKLYWDYDATTLRAGVVCNTTGWCGLGFSTNGQMVGSDAVIGVSNRDGSIVAYDYNLRSRLPPGTASCPNGVCEDITNSDLECESNVVNILGERDGIYMLFEFERPMGKSDACDQPVSSPFVLWSLGAVTTTGEASLVQHFFQSSTTFNFSRPYPNPNATSSSETPSSSVPTSSMSSSYSSSSLSPSTTSSSSTSSESTVAIQSSPEPSKGFPIWAIAVIAVVGFLLIFLILFVIIYFSVRAYRRRRHEGNFY